MEQLINDLFEPCPELVYYLLPKVGEEKSIPEVITLSKNALLELIEDYDENTDPVTLEAGHKRLICAIVAAHPRLGVPKVQSSELSEHSKLEQRSLQNGDIRLLEKLKKLNKEYEVAFPGLRFVVWVNGRSRETIMDIMVTRIKRGSWILEVKDAFIAMCDIASDRYRKTKI